ncbi:MAG: hypothetical protein JSS51_11530 [Planctomycetes bacterium]|nr:hypothetical protein [Planctomycetota bacterium]
MLTWTRVAAALAMAIGVGLAAAGEARKPKVLLVNASTYISDVQSKLSGSGVFGAVDLFDAAAGTPTLATLKGYDAVMVTSDSLFADATTLGNNLADYVDAGGGVVTTTFANTTFSVASVPGGRWSPGYLVMASAAIASLPQTLDLTSITQPNHPILIGVGSFSGGTSSYRANQNSVVAGATILAKWTGGNVLVATGPLPGRADLNLYPPSKDARADFWDTSTDGVKLMVNALLYTMRPRVLLVHADFPAYVADVQAKIKGTGTLGQVDVFDASAGTPTLAQLQNYDAALVWSDNLFQNPIALGNVMADYVDAGGGVVTAVFENGGVPNSNLQGRWTGTYDLIPFGPSASGAATLGAVTYASHPIMNGVGSFNGGGGSYRPNTTALNPGAFKVAQWSDGRTLVAASTRYPNRADLGMYPPSSAASGSLWVVGTNGDKLMANALLYVSKPYVACLPADPLSTDVTAKLIASRRFSGVGSIDVNAGTPALAALSPFNAVMTWSNNAYSNATALGNTLADYVDAGGAGVTAVFGNAFSPGNLTPGGRWISQGYDIAPTAALTNQTTGQAFLGTILEPANPIARFVRKFDGTATSWRSLATPLLRGRSIMNWSDGRMLVSVHNFRKRADLGYWPVSNSSTNGWNRLTDGTWMTANVLEYAVRHKPCPGDFNGDGQVDDADFVRFAAYYDNLVDPRGDLTGDGLTEDSDFVVFAGSYDTLVCP